MLVKLDETLMGFVHGKNASMLVERANQSKKRRMYKLRNHYTDKEKWEM